jgi:hypothetical protein
MTRNFEVQDGRARPPAAENTWASIAAGQCNQPSSDCVQLPLRAQSQLLQDQGYLGQLTITTLDQRFDRIDQSGNGNGIIERDDLRNFIQRQQMQPSESRDTDAMLGAQNALRYMETTGREFITRMDVRSALKDGLLPEARAMGNAAKQYDGLVGVMRQINPDAIINGNQINVGELRTAMAQQPERFTPAQQAAVKALLRDSYATAHSSNGIMAGWNALFGGNDNRYFSPEGVSARAQELGASSRVRPYITPSTRIGRSI